MKCDVWSMIVVMDVKSGMVCSGRAAKRFFRVVLCFVFNNSWRKLT